MCSQRAGLPDALSTNVYYKARRLDLTSRPSLTRPPTKIIDYPLHIVNFVLQVANITAETQDHDNESDGVVHEAADRAIPKETSPCEFKRLPQKNDVRAGIFQRNLGSVYKVPDERLETLVLPVQEPQQRQHTHDVVIIRVHEGKLDRVEGYDIGLRIQLATHKNAACLHHVERAFGEDNPTADACHSFLSLPVRPTEYADDKVDDEGNHRIHRIADPVEEQDGDDRFLILR